MLGSSPLDNYVGADLGGWGYLANKAVWHNKGKAAAYGELFKEGDVIGVTLDLTPPPPPPQPAASSSGSLASSMHTMPKSPTVLAPPGNAHGNGTLSFSRNGRPLGIAVSNLLAAVSPPDGSDPFGGFGSSGGGNGHSGIDAGFGGRSPPRRGGGRGGNARNSTNSSSSSGSTEGLGGNSSSIGSNRRRRVPPLLLYPAFSMYNRDDQISLLPSPFPGLFGAGAAAARAHAAAFACQQRQQQRLWRSRALHLHDAASSSSPMAASGDKTGASSASSGGDSGGVASTLGGGTASAEALIEGLATLTDLFQALHRTDSYHHGGASSSMSVPTPLPSENEVVQNGAEEQAEPPNVETTGAALFAALFSTDPEMGAPSTLLASEALRWWRKWRSGTRVAALTKEGLPLWCRTCSLRFTRTKQSTVSSNESKSGGDKGAVEWDGANDDDRDDDENDEDESAHAAGNAALAQLGLEAGDVIELSAATTSRREASSSSPPRAGAPRRALVLGTSGGRLWVAPASVTLAAAAAGGIDGGGGSSSSSSSSSSVEVGLNADGNRSTENMGNSGDVALWRSGVGSWAAASLAGCLPPATSPPTAATPAPSADAEPALFKAGNDDDEKARNEAGPVLRLRAGGFCLGAEAWTYQAVADLIAGGKDTLDRQGPSSKAGVGAGDEAPVSAQALRSRGARDQNMSDIDDDHRQPPVQDQPKQQRRLSATAELRQTAVCFAQWTADLDTELSNCLEATLQACFDACAKESIASSSTTASALALGARRALPFFLPYVLAEQATQDPSTKNKIKRADDPFGPPSNFCMPPLLLQKWRALVAHSPGGARSVQLRAALLLSLNQRMAGLSRLVDWGRVGSSGSAGRGGVTARSADEINRGKKDCQWNKSAARNLSLSSLLADTGAKRLLLRTKALVLTQRCAATAPNPPETRLAPVVAWELCCGTALPPVLAPGAALTALAAESAAQEAGSHDKAEASTSPVAGGASFVNPSVTAVDHDDARARALPPVSFDAASPLVVPYRLVARRSPLPCRTDIGGLSLTSAGLDSVGGGGSNIPTSLRTAGDGSSSVPTMTLVVQSTEHFLHRHHAALAPSKTGVKHSDVGALLGSILGQVLRQMADLRPCDLRHQTTSLSIHGDAVKEEDEKGEHENDDGQEGEDRDCDDVNSPVLCLWELQPRSFQVVLVDPLGHRCISPTNDLKSSKAAHSDAVGHAALWRALLFAACRDAQTGPMPLLCPPLAHEGGAPDTVPCSSSLLGINPEFMRHDERAARLGWYFGLGQVFGLALRTSVRLPLRLQPSLWAAIVSTDFTYSGGVNAVTADASDAAVTPRAAAEAEAAAAAMASGLCTILPRDALVLLNGTDLEALLALPPAASDAVAAAWPVHY